MEEKAIEIAFSYPQELRDKAILLLKQGFSKSRISKEMGISFTTIRRWTAGFDSPYGINYPQGIKEKAVELAKKGLNRTEIAKELHAGYYSVLVWTRGINTWHKHLPYPSILKRKARRMVRSGVPKMEVAARLGISRNALYDWTCDIHTANSRLTGAAEKILVEVVEKGYFFPKPAQLNICRTLKQNVGLRLTRLNGKWILYAPSEKDKAIKAIIEKSRLNYLSRQRLSNLKLLFYGFNIREKSD